MFADLGLPAAARGGSWDLAGRSWAFVLDLCGIILDRSGARFVVVVVHHFDSIMRFIDSIRCYVDSLSTRPGGLCEAIKSAARLTP